MNCTIECLVHALGVTKGALSLAARDPYVLVHYADPLHAMIALIVTLIAVCFLLSIAMDNYSQVDRLWSLLPPFIIAFYAYRSPVLDARLTMMALLSIAWGLRLTYNFWRKGGYNPTDEDYRWQPLKARIRPYPVWLLFNFFFICVFQLSLLFLISSPADVVYRNAGKVPLGSVDLLLVFSFLLLLSIESVADQQQWVFQNEKYRLINAGLPRSGDYKRGFLTRGLFAFSRHPNFFAEISMWWVMYLFAVNTTGVWIHWTLAGPILLTLLFQGSTTYTERLTLAKYPSYAQYQATTSRLIPLPSSSEDDEEETDRKHAHVASASHSNTPASPSGVRSKKKTDLIASATSSTSSKASNASSKTSETPASPKPRVSRPKVVAEEPSAASVPAKIASPKGRRSSTVPKATEPEMEPPSTRARAHKAAATPASPKGRSRRASHI